MQLPTLSQPNWELLANFARREVRGRYKGSWLGMAWTLIIPLVLMLTYTVVFSYILPVGADLPHYWLYLLVGIAFWSIFGGSFTAGAVSLIGNKGLVTKVPFTRALLPIASLASQALTTLVMFGIMVPLAIAFTPGHGWTLLLLPVIFVAVGMLVVGIALAMAVINVFFRDAEHIVAALLIPWFFITPIIYRLSSIGVLKENVWAWRLLTWGNPASPYVLSLQDVVYFGRVPGWQMWVYMFGVGALVLAGGWTLFNRLQRDLAVEL